MKKRYSLYPNYKFHLIWNGRTVAAFTKAKALTRSTPPPNPNQATYEAITLERGVTHDPEFEQWANTISDFHSSSAGISLRELRRDIKIELYNEAGQTAVTYNIFHCWVSEYQALPELDANAVAIQSLRLENEGWERTPDHPKPRDQS